MISLPQNILKFFQIYILGYYTAKKQKQKKTSVGL